ncbi:MAG: ABC transporter permease [Lentisphaeria bacterium]
MGPFNFIIENYERCITLTVEHLILVGLALGIALLIGVPTGILITRHEAIAKRIINAANILMTIPSIALFGFMLPLLSPFGQGMGKVPAVTALVLYSQLPIIRNTYTAIKNVPPELIDAGRGMGMSQWRLLKEVEIPLAVPVILAGLRTAAVMSIGIAAIAAYIGAGGLGVFIQRGIDQAYDEKVIAGAILVSLLAIVVDAGTAAFEKLATPTGIKVQRKTGQQ